MERKPRGAGGGGGGSWRRQIKTLLPPPPPAAQPGGSRLRASPGPPRPRARPGPRKFETPLPSHVNGGRPGAGAPRPPSPHPESKLARRGDARHGVGPRTGRGKGHGWPAGSLIPGARGARGRRPALRSRRRTRRAAAEGALPAPARSRASSIARHPSSRSRGAGTANGSARLPGASKTTIRKWLQLNCFSAPPLRKCPSAREEWRRRSGGRHPERGAGFGPTSTPLRPKTQLGAQKATRRIPRRRASQRPRRPHSPGVWSAGTSCSGRESSKPI